jgi:hypothetical protein
MRQSQTMRCGSGAVGFRSGLVLLGVIASVLAAWADDAAAGSFSGDPLADGWILRGNSMTLGVAVNSLADPTIYAPYDYDIYTQAFQVSPGDGIANGVIQNGDTVIGVGAVMRAAYDLNKAQVKFGDGTSTFAPSTYVPGSTGHEHDTGDGVAGVAWAGPNGFLTNVTGMADWGLAAPRLVTQMQGSSTATVAGYVPGGVLFMSTSMPAGPLASFEFILDNLAMGAGWGGIPQGGQFIVTAQHEGEPCNWTNALGTTPPVYSPEPATLTLLALGGAVVAARRRRRI